MATSKHTITAEIKVNFQLSDMPADEHETAYPEVEITYSFVKGCPARIRYDENDHPAEPHELEVLDAKLINGDGLAQTQDQLLEWAQEWLYDEGYDRAVENALERAS